MSMIPTAIKIASSTGKILKRSMPQWEVSRFIYKQIIKDTGDNWMYQPVVFCVFFIK